MHTSVLPTRLTRPGFETSCTERRLSVAGAAYVTAWVVGLLSGPTTPSATAAAEDIHRYYLDSPSAILVQSSLIHGIAGAALLVLATTIPIATGAARGIRRAVIGSGAVAAVLSFVQVAIAVTAAAMAPASPASTSAALFDAINLTDAAKLVALAVFTGIATVAATRAQMAPRWLRGIAAMLVVLLPLGGAAFLVDDTALRTCLYVSLPVLLLWAGSTAFVVGRRAG